MSAGTAYVLVPRGASLGRDRATAAFASRLAKNTGRNIGVGFLDGGTPSLVEALDAHRAAGTATVVLIPVAIPRDGNLTAWTRKVAADWATRHSNAPSLRLGQALDDETVAAALIADLDGEAEAIEPAADAISDPAWSRIPSFRHHVFVCRGSRCSARGSAANAAALAALLRERGLGDDEVLLTRTGCLYPCNRGPMLVVPRGEREQA